MININKLVRENVANMKAYSSARSEFSGLDGVFLDANENPYNNGVNRYPDPYQRSLKKKIAEIKAIDEQKIMLGNGSDEVLDLLFRAFCEPKQDNVIVTTPSYGMYGVLANLNNVELKNVQYEADFSLDVDKIIAAVDDNTKMIILCSPNNPTGNVIEKSVVENILLNTNCIVIVDEAYIDFTEKESFINSLNNYNQLVVSQTLSKYYGMAGIRLGMCFANEEIIAILNKIKPPYNVNVLTQNIAIDLLNSYNGTYKKEVIEQRNLLSNEIRKLTFVEKVYPSDANFILVKTKDANYIYKTLLDKNIIVRNRTKEVLCENCIRITIGTPHENEKLINALKEIK